MTVEQMPIEMTMFIGFRGVKKKRFSGSRLKIADLKKVILNNQLGISVALKVFIDVLHS